MTVGLDWLSGVAEWIDRRIGWSKLPLPVAPVQRHRHPMTTPTASLALWPASNGFIPNEEQSHR